MKTGVKVSDAMSSKPVCIKPDATIEQCSKLMSRKHIGGVLVKIKQKLAGILTDKDIVKNVVAKNKNAKKLKVRDIMVRKVTTIAPEKDLYYAMNVLKKKGFKHLPVVKNDKLIGILTFKDILNIEPTLYEIFKEESEIKASRRKGVKGARYIEGECDSCSNYGQLYVIEDQNLCEECKDRVSGKKEPVKDIY